MDLQVNKVMNPTTKIDVLLNVWQTGRATFAPEFEQKTTELLAYLKELPRTVVAFSGGVDSATIAGLLTIARGEPVEVMTAVGPALSSRQKQMAQEVANYLGAQHRWIDAQEILNPDYQKNARDRCFHCKSQLYLAATQLVQSCSNVLLVNGTNADDLQDYRPGLEAAKQFRVISPLAEFGFNKSMVRQLARALSLPVADLPASPCLASRIQYGVSVTAERLQRIEKAEEILWRENFTDVRVRLLDGEVASIEVPVGETQRFEHQAFRDKVFSELMLLGFDSVQLQVEGLKSGRLNEKLISIGRIPNNGC